MDVFTRRGVIDADGFRDNQVFTVHADCLFRDRILAVDFHLLQISFGNKIIICIKEDKYVMSIVTDRSKRPCGCHNRM